MSSGITIPLRYLKGEDANAYYPVYIVAPPENIPELNGYVMRIAKDKVEVAGKIHIYSGNEWNKANKEFLFMFEKEVKDPHQRSKRYRYDEDEMLLLYKKSTSSDFEKKLEERTKISKSGSGKLIRAKYITYDKGKHVKTPHLNWFISPDSDPNWVYEFDYDPLRNRGKHSRDAKGFKILEEYSVKDISILLEAKEDLPDLLSELKDIREIKIHYPNPDDEFIYNEDLDDEDLDDEDQSEDYTLKSPGESLAEIGFDSMIPDEIRKNSSTDELRKELCKIGNYFESRCTEFIEEYRQKKFEILRNKIKDLIGIEIKLDLAYEEELCSIKHLIS